MFTGGRDGTIRCWEGFARKTVSAVLHGHSDWVNDIVMLQDNVLASCSSDCTVRLWSLKPEDGHCVGHVIGRHEDHVKALAFAPACGMLASAGFDRRVLLWDVHRFKQEHFSPVAGSDGGHRDSIYALDANAHGSLLATASVDTDIRLWDPRDLGNSLRLRGHSDVVRCVKLLPDGMRLLSCGSDGSMRIWHIGERRCEQVLTPHGGSAIFAILPLPDVSRGCSGGGDSGGTHILSADSAGEVRVTDLSPSGAPSTVVCHAKAPVLDLHVIPDFDCRCGALEAMRELAGTVDADDEALASEPSEVGGGGSQVLLCVATVHPTLQCWRLEASASHVPSSTGHNSTACELRLSSGVTLPGVAAVRRHSILPSRVQVAKHPSPRTINRGPDSRCTHDAGAHRGLKWGVRVMALAYVCVRSAIRGLSRRQWQISIAFR